MSKDKEKEKHGFLYSLFTQKCPRCRTGDMFKEKSAYKLKTCMKMNEHCPSCGQRMEIETGFYYGTGYVSYALTVAFSVTTFVAWWVLLGFSLHDNSVAWWLGTNSVLMILLQPFFMRLSRAVWLAFFVKYDANWKSEKIV